MCLIGFGPLYLQSLEELQQVLEGGVPVTGELLAHCLMLLLQVAVGLVGLFEELQRMKQVR